MCSDFGRSEAQSMRFDTYNASASLVNQLIDSGVIRRVLHDGGDLILVQLQSGERVSLYLIERSIELYQIVDILEQDSADHIYTLFIFWGEMFLPGHGQWFEVEDWMAALLALYRDRIYAFDVFGREMFLFPVHFEGEGKYRYIRHGPTVDFNSLLCKDIHTASTYIAGFWRVAYFAEDAGQPRTDGKPHTPARTRLQACYEFLGLQADAGRDAVKQAYRQLARQYHPDLSDEPDAHTLMQRLNEAYAYILGHLGD